MLTQIQKSILILLSHNSSPYTVILNTQYQGRKWISVEHSSSTFSSAKLVQGKPKKLPTAKKVLKKLKKKQLKPCHKGLQLTRASSSIGRL